MAGVKGRSGRPRVPVAVHQQHGTFRQDRHGRLGAAPGPLAPPGRPSPPADLGPIARRAFCEVVEACARLKIGSPVDGLVVYQYAQLYAEVEGTAAARTALLGTLDALEATLPHLTGDERSTAYRTLVRLRQLEQKAISQLRQGRSALRMFLTECGLTPASRHRVQVPAEPPEPDPFDTFQSRRPA
jgi:phage terminase small subunit